MSYLHGSSDQVLSEVQYSPIVHYMPWSGLHINLWLVLTVLQAFKWPSVFGSAHVVPLPEQLCLLMNCIYWSGLGCTSCLSEGWFTFARSNSALYALVRTVLRIIQTRCIQHPIVNYIHWLGLQVSSWLCHLIYLPATQLGPMVHYIHWSGLSSVAESEIKSGGRWGSSWCYYQ